MELSGAILRVFEVRAKAGAAEALMRKLSDTSIDVVRGEPGNVGYVFGQSVASQDDTLVFVSVWQDLASIRLRFGERWQESFLPEGYEALIEQCSVRHLAVDGVLDEPKAS